MFATEWNVFAPDGQRARPPGRSTTTTSAPEPSRSPRRRRPVRTSRASRRRCIRRPARYSRVSRPTAHTSSWPPGERDPAAWRNARNPRATDRRSPRSLPAPGQPPLHEGRRLRHLRRLQGPLRRLRRFHRRRLEGLLHELGGTADPRTTPTRARTSTCGAKQRTRSPWSRSETTATGTATPAKSASSRSAASSSTRTPPTASSPAAPEGTATPTASSPRSAGDIVFYSPEALDGSRGDPKPRERVRLPRRENPVRIDAHHGQ